MALEPASSLFNTSAMMDSNDLVLLKVVSREELAHDEIFSIDKLNRFNVKNMESREEEKKRVVETCQQLCMLNEKKTVLVCSHGSPCTHMVEGLMGKKWEGKSFGYTCISVFCWEEMNGVMRFYEKVINDLVHTSINDNTVHIS